MRNLEAVLEAAGLTLGDVVRAGIFLVDMADFPVVNEAYASFMGDEPPARTTVGVASLPIGARIEIDMVAARRQDA
jgi:2-iminobutanoate/2-iminopropanoate deaminase